MNGIWYLALGVETLFIIGLISVSNRFYDNMENSLKINNNNNIS